MKAMSGYIMVDSGGLDLYDTSGQDIPGLYSRLAAAKATGKQVIMCNCVRNGNIDVTPIAAPVYYGEDDDIYFDIGNQFVISSDDHVHPT